MYISINTNLSIVTDETLTKLQKNYKKLGIYVIFNTRTITTNNQPTKKKISSGKKIFNLLLMYLRLKLCKLLSFYNLDDNDGYNL